MAYDFKKELKDQYYSKVKPIIIDMPEVNYVAVRGSGNPNDVDGEYSKAVSILYAISYTLRMSYKSDYKIDGYYEYVVPPLEGFWWQEDIKGVDLKNKDNFNFISCIRLPLFIKEEDFKWAIKEASLKKKIDCSSAEFLKFNEGKCVQIMHLGPYDTEIESVKLMDDFIKENGYENDINETRLHHEIYLSDPRKVEASKCKTIIRHPIKTIKKI